MTLRNGLLVLLAAAPLCGAAFEPAVRPVPPLPRRPAPILRAPAAAPRAESEELRRLKAAWSGTVVKRARARAASATAGLPARSAAAALAVLREEFWKEELNLRQDRAGAFEAMVRAPKGSAERRAWLQAIEVDTVLLDDYPPAYAALSHAALASRR